MAVQEAVKHIYVDPEICPQYTLNNADESQSGYVSTAMGDNMIYFLTEISCSEADHFPHTSESAIEILAKAVLGNS
jgi:hypothetical protein